MIEGPETTEAEPHQPDQDDEAQDCAERNKSAPKGMTVVQLRELGERLRKQGSWILCGQQSASDEPSMYLDEDEWKYELQKRFGDGTLDKK